MKIRTCRCRAWCIVIPDRVLFLVTDRCASYCRYCTRSRVVSGVGEQELHTEFEAAFRYLEEHTEVRDVLLSGGDALLFSDDEAGENSQPAAGDSAHRVSPHRHARPDFPAATDHAGALRDAAKISSALDERPRQSSARADHRSERRRSRRLANHGIPLGNQSVLLAGVNDDLETMKTLVHKLLMCRVRPYYLYQCDLINGSSHLRASVAKGIEIIEGLRGHTTGYGVPQFVIDAPGGGGKVPINPGYVLYHDNEKIVIRNYEGKIFEYPETGDENVQFAPQREYHDEYLYS